MSEEKKDFEVKDRRIFSEDGQKAASADEETPAADGPEGQAASSDPDSRKTETAAPPPPMALINNRHCLK